MSKAKKKFLIKKKMKVMDENGETWTVEDILRPTKFDCYILCSQVSMTSCHDEKTQVVYMALFDYHNDALYPTTKSNMKIFENKAKCSCRKKKPKDFWDLSLDLEDE